MKHSKSVRFLTMLLAVVMVVGMLPMSALAVEGVEEDAAPVTAVVTFDVNGGVGEYEAQEVTIGDLVAKPETNPTYESYEFAYWTANLEENLEWSFEENAVAGDMTLYAVWTPVKEEVEAVKYTVNHSILDRESDEFVLQESEEKSGNVGELTNAEPKDYEGCILFDEIQQLEIAEDGSTVVDVYYIELQEEAVAYVASSLYDTTVSNDYFKVIEEKVYDLAPGAQEYGLTLNNANGTDRKVVHVFAVDTKNEDIQVMPGYYGIDKLDPNNLPLDGVLDKAEFWKAMELTKTVKYYENMGYNVVGGMNTALAYDSNAPYGYMVWNGVVLGTPEVHKGAQTYLAIDKKGNCELRSMATPLTGNEQTAISANFGWLVKDGALVSKTEERTSSDASRSMIGIKADGTLIFCHVDGRNAPVSTGLSNYEMGEMMLALGCVNAVNCDGGGSSTFVSKRAGETSNTMRSVPSDGAERPTINSVILVSTAGASGVFEKALIETGYDYIAPGAHMEVEVTGLDTKGFSMDVPAEVTYKVAEDGMGTIADGVYTAGSTTGTATIQAVYNGIVVGELVLNVVHPESFGFAQEETVIPYSKSITLEVATAYGDDNWPVCVDGAYAYTLSNDAAASLTGDELTATTDETVAGVDVTVTYTPDPSKTGKLIVTYGKGSEIMFSFENGEHENFLGVDEMYAWANATGAPAPIQGNGNYSDNADSVVFLADKSNGQVKNGDHALGVTLDYTEAEFAGWSYNMFFHTFTEVEDRVLRDVANGKNATTFGMWVYIPEGAAGLAMQLQGCSKPDGTGGTGGHFYFTTTSGAVKNLNSCTEADIPASRWVYATCDLTQFGDYFALYNPYGNTGREPSFIRFYVKPTVAADLTFYFDDFTLDYSSAVDDRMLPSITNIEYAAGDVSAELGDGANINAAGAAFSAVVADVGNAGLNTASAQIFLDGNPVDTIVSGKKIVTANDLTLSDGPHTVTFEIADNLGNYNQVSKTFTVNGAKEKGVVYLDGHNDSGAMPEYDSVYYVDIKTSAAETVDYVEANIQLNTANKWELEQMIVAPGWEVEYFQLDADREIVAYGARSDIHSVENVVSISLTRKDDCELSGEQTLLSIPVRLWSWEGINHVTGEAITPEAQYKSGYCPVVNVTVSVLFGYAETTDGDVTFGGGIDEKTKINDTVYEWHYHHDENPTVLNQAPTCEVDGFENRTYCETCKSVIDWGTKLPATGHTYEIVDNQLVCDCGKVITGNGLVTVGDKIYCLIADKLVTGWQAIGDGWCYVAASTKEVQTGEFTVSGLKYTADENGIVIKGAWVTDAKGTKYSYGPKYYTRQWVTIDGVEYYFGTDSYMYTGAQWIPVNRNNMKEGVIWYQFADDGAYVGLINGFVNHHSSGIKYYVVDGVYTYGGLMQIDGDYYYARTSGEIVCGKTYWVTKSNDLMPSGDYTFDVDGKMINPPVVKPEQPDPEQPPVTPDPEQPPVTPDPEQPSVKNGICADEKGKLFWYVNDVKTYGGLLHLDTDGDGVADAYYYARSSGEIVVNRKYYITKNNDILPIADYTFGADGKMVNPPVTPDPEQPPVTPDPEQPPVTPDPEQPTVKNGVCADEKGKLFWYVNDVKTYGGLLHLDTDGDGVADAYYYARSSGEIVVNREYYISKNNDILPIACYTFGADGKMVNPPAA